MGLSIIRRNILLTFWKYFIRTILTIAFIAYLLININIFHAYITYPEYIYQTDLTVFLTGARIIRDRQTNKLYNTDTQRNYQNKVVAPLYRETLFLPFRNIPLIAVLYIPLTYLSLRTSTIVVFIINLILLFVFHRLFTKYTPGSNNISWLWILPIIFWPSLATLIVGQHMGIILLIYALIYIYLYKKKDLLVGVWSSLLLIRPHNLLFLPFLYFMVKKRKDYIVGLVVSSVVFLILNLLVANYSVLMQIPQFSLSVEYAAFGNRAYHLASVYFMIMHIFPSFVQATIIALNLVLYIIFLIVFIIKRKYFTQAENFFVALLIALLFSIHVLSHDLLPLLIPMYLLIREQNSKMNENLRKIILLTLFLAPIFIVLRIAVFTVFLLMLILIYYLFLKDNNILSLRFFPKKNK